MYAYLKAKRAHAGGWGRCDNSNTVTISCNQIQQPCNKYKLCEAYNVFVRLAKGAELVRLY